MVKSWQKLWRIDSSFEKQERQDPSYMCKFKAFLSSTFPKVPMAQGIRKLKILYLFGGK